MLVKIIVPDSVTYTYCIRNSTLVVEVLAQAADNLELVLDCESIDGSLDDVADVRLVNGNEAVVVHVRKETHDELAVHAISDTTVARNGLAKVLDTKRALQTGGKESTKGGNEGGESSKAQDVELHGLDVESLIQTQGLIQAEDFEGVGLRNEGRVRDTLETGQNVRTEIIDGANEVFVAHQHVGHKETKDDRADPSTNETLHSLLRRQLNQLSTSEGDTTDVGENVIGDDKRRGKEEPNHALEDVVHDEMGLDDDQVQRHVSPGKVLELQLVGVLTQGADEDHEA